MRIVVNMRLLLKGRLDGIGWFTHESFSRIVKQHPEHEFIFIFDRKCCNDFIYAPNVKAVVVPPATRDPLLFFLHFNIFLPIYLRRIKPDIYISPDGFLPSSINVKTLAVIHDLNFEHHPDLLPARYSRMYKRTFPHYARRANRIATVSEFSAKDLEEQYDVSPEKIDVVYNGASSHFKPISDDEKLAVREKYSQGKPFFVHVGTLHPRKNISRLLQAYDLFRDKNPNGAKLLLAGSKMWWTPALKKAYENMKHKDEVIFTGRLSDNELAALVASAKALLMVSVFEGFGIPIVEAFSCGTAVIASNITSLPEVAGDAALMIDPYDINSIENALNEIENNPELLKKLESLAMKRSGIFTWDKTADLLWKSIIKTVES